MTQTNSRMQEAEQPAAAAAIAARPTARGKFLFVGREKLYVRGVTYGTFRPHEAGHAYPDPGVVDRDFAQMAANGLNAVRTYTVPPRWLLDLAQRHGLLVMVGLPWEQHVAFLDERERARSIEARVRDGVRACAAHPAVLSYAVGNEIPAAIVRWHGRERVERFIEGLYQTAKEADPESLVTYVSFPSTEYLELPSLDLVCFNVYLEDRRALEAYLARIQNLAGDRPVMMAELGLDSRTHGLEAQARSLEWQIDATFASGCAGAFVFSWTDEWHRGGHEIEDWDFGLTDRERWPKPALATVRAAYGRVPAGDARSWPRVSVVVCSHNGAGTLHDCLEGVRELDYPEFEVIIVDDGSTDATGAIAAEYGFRVIATDNAGLASARNVGLEEATGEIVAYLDDDARPDPDWLTYLARAFREGDYAGVGGPNIAPAGDGSIAECVANAPGGPTHVLTSDREAEHIPGCNMAFRRASLEAVGGFDPRFRVAGDDVDVCWLLRERGWKLGFAPAAVVWHHRRNSVRAYWRQQKAYGRAEALLERKWPEKYNPAGQPLWRGRLYARRPDRSRPRRRQRIRYGVWGTSLFQSVYEPAQARPLALALTPQWLLVLGTLVVVSALGQLWTPLLAALPLLVLAVGAPLAQAALGAASASFESASRLGRAKSRLLTGALHLLQPLARLLGRLGHGLTPWRRLGRSRPGLPRASTGVLWSERWQDPRRRVAVLEAAVIAEGATVRRGGEWDRWDLQVSGGALAGVRLLAAVEEHGAGRQLVRLRYWPVVGSPALLSPLVAALALGAVLDGAAAAAWALGALAVGILGRTGWECAVATGIANRTLRRAQAAEAAQVALSAPPGRADIPKLERGASATEPDDDGSRRRERAAA